MAWILARKRDETQTETERQERHRNEWCVQREEDKWAEMKTERKRTESDI